jgi:plastocyanin
MSRIHTLQLCLVLVLAAAVGSASAGEIVGKVSYAGTAPEPETIKITKDQAVCGKTPQVESSLLVSADKGVKNVVVKITDPKDGKTMTAPEQNATVDQNGCKFNPRVTIVAAGAPVDILNSDGILHNIHTYPEHNKPFNKAQPKFRKKMTETFPEPDVIRVACDVHSWMTGYVIVAAHPYYGLSDEAGSFRIADVPAGSYTLEYWHEKLGTQTAKVTVPASGSVTAEFEYPAE